MSKLKKVEIDYEAFIDPETGENLDPELIRDWIEDEYSEDTNLIFDDPNPDTLILRTARNQSDEFSW